MLSNFRRKTGALSTVPGTPRITSTTPGDTLLLPGAVAHLDGGLQSLLSLPQMGETSEAGGDMWSLGEEAQDFAWPTELSPSNLPVWLQDGVSLPEQVLSLLWILMTTAWQNFTDLGLPADGSDSLFLPLEYVSLSIGKPMPLDQPCILRLANMFLPSGSTGNANYQFALPDSGDVGAEAW